MGIKEGTPYKPVTLETAGLTSKAPGAAPRLKGQAARWEEPNAREPVQRRGG